MPPCAPIYHPAPCTWGRTTGNSMFLQEIWGYCGVIIDLKQVMIIFNLFCGPRRLSCSSGSFTGLLTMAPYCTGNYLSLHQCVEISHWWEANTRQPAAETRQRTGRELSITENLPLDSASWAFRMCFIPFFLHCQIQTPWIIIESTPVCLYLAFNLLPTLKQRKT